MCQKCFKRELSEELINYSTDLNTIKQLVLNGADINYQRKDGWCILFQVACNGDLEIFEEIVKMGADLNLTDKKFRNALYWAMYKNNIEIAKRLVDLGIDTTADVYPGMTLLDYAIYKKNDTLVDYFSNYEGDSVIYAKGRHLAA